MQSSTTNVRRVGGGGESWLRVAASPRLGARVAGHRFIAGCRAIFMRNLPFSRDVPLYEQGTHRSGNAAYNVYPLLVVQYPCGFLYVSPSLSLARTVTGGT